MIDIMEEQKAITNMGGTMRLGAYECILDQHSKTFEAYKANTYRNATVTATNSTMTISRSTKGGYEMRGYQSGIRFSGNN